MLLWSLFSPYKHCIVNPPLCNFKSSHFAISILLSFVEFMLILLLPSKSIFPLPLCDFLFSESNIFLPGFHLSFSMSVHQRQLMLWWSFLLHFSNNLSLSALFPSQLLCMASPLTALFCDVLNLILTPVEDTNAPALLCMPVGMLPLIYSTCCCWIHYCRFSSASRLFT